MDQLQADARLLLGSIDLDPSELSVVLCDDAFIRVLNRDHRGKDSATDVLSFAMQEGEGGLDDDPVLGDLVISYIKRDIGIKDMGAVIQGHGGILDRVDSMIFVVPIFFHVVRWVHGIY